MIHPFISGNKWRKLKYTLENARNQGKDHLITFGGAYSNHLVATACAAAKFGFRSTGFVRGEQVSNPSLMLCKLFGMELHFISRERYRGKQEVYNSFFGKLSNTYFIDEGGASNEAVEGCAELVRELSQPFDHIFCAAGTGTTAAGILKGIYEFSPGTALHMVPVLKNGAFIKDEVSRYVAATNLHLHTDYHFGGYARTTPELLNFISKFAARTGILLDQVYTGKMAFAAYQLISENAFAEGSKILLVHTGGLLGLMSQAEKILPTEFLVDPPASQ